MECLKSSGVIDGLAQMVLKLREPAQRYFGSVPSAVAVICIFYGGYLLTIASVFIETHNYYDPVIINVGAGLCFLLAALNAAVLCFIFMKNDALIYQLSSINLAMNMITGVFSIVMIFWSSISCRDPVVPLCEGGHFVLSLLYMSLLYCQMSEKKKGEETDSMNDHDGWLNNNLAQQSFSIPIHEQFAKAHADTPAVFSPSSCTNKYISDPTPTNNILSTSNRDTNTDPVS